MCTPWYSQFFFNPCPRYVSYFQSSFVQPTYISLFNIIPLPFLKLKRCFALAPSRASSSHSFLKYKVFYWNLIIDVMCIEQWLWPYILCSESAKNVRVIWWEFYCGMLQRYSQGLKTAWHLFLRTFLFQVLSLVESVNISSDLQQEKGKKYLISFLHLCIL